MGSAAAAAQHHNTTVHGASCLCARGSSRRTRPGQLDAARVSGERSCRSVDASRSGGCANGPAHAPQEGAEEQRSGYYRCVRHSWLEAKASGPAVNGGPLANGGVGDGGRALHRSVGFGITITPNADSAPTSGGCDDLTAQSCGFLSMAAAGARRWRRQPRQLTKMAMVGDGAAC